MTLLNAHGEEMPILWRSTPNHRPNRVFRALSLVVGVALVTIGNLPGALPAEAAPNPTPPINNLAKTPYLGWNTYYGQGAAINERTMRESVDAIVSRGLKKAGYEYVWIDGGWWDGTRDAAGAISTNPAQWPGGMKAVADYVHSKGLKAGIYTDAGTNGCGGVNQGSFGHYQQDFNQFAAQGYDAVKVDFCGARAQNLNPADTYAKVRDALLGNSSHRPMLLNICNPFVSYTGAPAGESAHDSWQFGPSTGNSWRTDTDVGYSHDIQFTNVLRNLDNNNAHPEAAGPGHWNDPDYLGPELGMTPNQAEAQFALWAISAAPLILGSDVRTVSDATIAMLTNPEVLAINQDPLGIQGVPISTVGDSQVYVKQLANGDRAVALLNRGPAPQVISTDAKAVGLRPAGGYTMRDVLRHSSSSTGGAIAANVPAESVAMFRVSAGSVARDIPPSTSLLPVAVPPAYPGSDLLIAIPGVPLQVTAGIRNDGLQPLLNVALTLQTPDGWGSAPAGPVVVGTLAPGASITRQWTVTAPSDAQPAVAAALTVNTAYQWSPRQADGRRGNRPRLVDAQAASTTSVHVVPPAPTTTMALSDQPWLRATSGWNVAQANAEVGGGPMRLGTTTYANGIGVASPSIVDYYLGRHCSALSATIGIDDVARGGLGGTAVFRIVGDGRVLFDSGVVAQSATQDIAVNLTGVGVVTLDVGDAGDGGGNDRADWANVQVTCAP
jgi:alpha-galactosidase